LNKSKSATDLTSLFGVDWNLSSLTGVADLAASFDEGIPVLNFQENGKLSGTDGCNNISGMVSLDDLKAGKLDLSRLASTRRACSFKGPDAFQNALRNTTSYKLEDDKLQLLSSSQAVLAELAK